MNRDDKYQSGQEENFDSSGFIFGLIMGILIGAIIAVLIYRNNKNEVIQALKRKINKFIINLNKKSSPKTSGKKYISKSKKTAPRIFLTK